MSTACSLRTEVERWAKLGCRETCPETLTEHSTHCVACRDFIAEVQQVRESVREIPERELSEQRCNRIRNNLVATASSQRKNVAGTTAGRSLAPRWAMAAAFALIVGTSALTVFKKNPAVRAHSEVANAAEVTLVDSAIGHTLQPGPNEVYELVQGLAEFSVKHLAPHQRYRVLVGDDQVEVRGTRFQVTAQQRLLQSVRVFEGQVQVTRAGQSVLLEAGQKWVRELTTAESTNPIPPQTHVDTEHSNTSAPPQSTPRAPSSPVTGFAPNANLFDVAFKAALTRLRSGDAAGALADLDTLLNAQSIDAGRRADVLYWSAVASHRNGNDRVAEKRLRQFLGAQPTGWYAPDAALMLGEILVVSGQPRLAKPWLKRAAESGRPNTSNRARVLLDRI